MAAAAWTIYNEFKATLGLKALNLNTDTIKMALFKSTSNAGSASLATAQYATLTNETTNANGYTTGGVTLGSVAYSQAAGVATFTVGTGSWTASGGTIVCRFCVLYDNTATNKDLICYTTLDSTPADITVLNGQTLNVTINASGVFTLT